MREEFNMFENGCMIASETVFTAVEYLENIIKAALKVHEKTRLQRAVEDTA